MNLQLEETTWNFDSEYDWNFLGEKTVFGLKNSGYFWSNGLETWETWVKILDYGANEDDWIERRWSRNHLVLKTGNTTSWAVTRRTVSAGEEILLAITTQIYETTIFLFSGDGFLMKERLMDMGLTAIDAFQPVHRWTLYSGQAWAICSYRSDIAILDSNLNILGKHSPLVMEGRLRRFFVSEAGTPISAVTSPSGNLIFMWPSFSSTNEPTLTSRTFLRSWGIFLMNPRADDISNPLFCRIWGEKVFCLRFTDTHETHITNPDFEPFRDGSEMANFTTICEVDRFPTKLVSGDFTFISEKCVLYPDRKEITPVENLNARFGINALDPVQGFKNHASRVDEDMVWLLQFNRLLRLRVKQDHALRNRDQLAKGAAFAFAKNIMASLPDEQTQKWFACAVAYLRPTNYAHRAPKKPLDETKPAELNP